MEPTTHFAFLEQARNAAITWLERRGAIFGPHHRIEIGRLGAMAGSETGVSSTLGIFWRLRLDYDPNKGPHYNAEYGTGSEREKHAFTFPGSPDLMARLARHRQPRSG
jgi:hypothetical protein